MGDTKLPDVLFLLFTLILAAKFTQGHKSCHTLLHQFFIFHHSPAFYYILYIFILLLLILLLPLIVFFLHVQFHFTFLSFNSCCVYCIELRRVISNPGWLSFFMFMFMNFIATSFKRMCFWCILNLSLLMQE